MRSALSGFVVLGGMLALSVVLAAMPFYAAMGVQVVAADEPTSVLEIVKANRPCHAAPLRVLSIHDADTLKADVLLPFGVTLRDKPIRAFGYDAWEISRVRQTVDVTLNEIAKGKEAKAALEQLITTGTLYVEDSGESDPYGRVSAWLWVKTKAGEWISVADWMQARGHCRK